MMRSAEYRSSRRQDARLGRRDVLRGGAAAAAFGLVAPSPLRAADRLKINIVNTAGNTNVVLATVLKQEGFFEDLGLDANILHVSDGSKLIGSLLSGESDMCALSGFGQVLPAIEKGAKLKILAGGAVLGLQAILTKNPAIKTVKDLEGRTVGTGSLGALLHQLVVAMLRKRGVDEKKVKFVNVGGSPDVFRAIVAGTVDAGPCEIWLAGRFGTHVLDDARFYTDLTEYTYQASYASDRAIASKREAIVRTLAAYARLYRFLGEERSREPFVKAFTTAISKDNREDGEAQWQFYHEHKPFAADLVLTEERVRYMQDLNVSLGVQKRVLPYDQVCDMSLARDAVKLLG
jgi:ABC-type nitrate/sulfonate/bicarbonate transport system substrate-binding protein